MTREIKFRGKSLDNGEWWYGSLVILNGRYFIFNDEGRYEVEPATVGQFTGLKDKNGREIYEDDIMSLGDMKGRIGYVDYREMHPAFMLVTRNVDFVLYYRNSERQYEVLGNIHDNPDLLKGGHNE